MKNEKIISFFYLKIFILFVALLFIGSLFIKVISEIVTSNFTNNSFTVLYVARDSKIITVDKSANTASFFAIGDVRKLVKGQSPFEASITLGIPIDAEIIDNSNFPPRNIADFTSAKREMGYIFGGDEALYKKLNYYDIYKFINALRNVPNENKKEARVNIFDEKTMNTTLKDSFKDSLIANSSYTVEVVNGTQINGLANLVANILTKKGYNVISVRTATKEPINSFVGYLGSPNNFVASIVHFTGFALKAKKTSPTTDVSIYLGSDLDAQLNP